MKKTSLFLITSILILLISTPVSGSEREEFFSAQGKKIYSLGFNVGTAFASPMLILNFNGTIAPLPFMFFEIGGDLGLINGLAGEEVRIEDITYSSGYFYGRLNGYVPYGKRRFDSYGRPREAGGWHLGLGFGIMNSEYSYIISPRERIVVSVQTPTLDAATGFFIGYGHILIKLSYAARATMDLKNLIGVNHRFMLGVVYRIY